jgi:hypothetical protein
MTFTRRPRVPTAAAILHSAHKQKHMFKGAWGHTQVGWAADGKSIPHYEKYV